MKHMINWLIYAALFSCVPILTTLAWDYAITQNSLEFWKGVRFMDFLICGFCLIGGALGDAFNSKKQPSGPTVGLGIIAAIAAFGLYIYAKAAYNTSPNPSGLYVRDSFFMTTIAGFYIFSLIFSGTIVAISKKS